MIGRKVSPGCAWHARIALDCILNGYHKILESVEFVSFCHCWICVMAQHEIPGYLIPAPGFKSRKAAQVSAFFATKETGRNAGVIEKLKLIKLIYLSEREFIREYEFPMLMDELYSLPHGPICSGAVNGIDGRIDHDTWGAFISRHGRAHIVSVKKFQRADFDELSDAEIDVLEKVWKDFGRMSSSMIRNWTHDPSNCPEYIEVINGRKAISYRTLLENLNNPCAEEISEEIDDMRFVQGMLSA